MSDTAGPDAAHGHARAPFGNLDAYWAENPARLLERLHSSPAGLTSAEAGARLERFGPNATRERMTPSRVATLARQLRSPLILLLIFAATTSAATGAWIDAIVVLVIVAGTAGVGYARELDAERAAAALEDRVRTKTVVVRDGVPATIAIDEVVPGDVMLLKAGSLVAADGVVLESQDCYVSQAELTGENMPVLKRPGAAAAGAGLAARHNCLFMGTSVRSGTARAIAVRTGRSTEYGRIARRLRIERPETGFDRGIRHFGYLLTIAMLMLVLVVFAIHVFLGRPPIDTLLFAVALAVGLSPELLPAILTVNLGRASQRMARRGVLVRRLSAIENLGSMDVLCTDKTGTLTEGRIALDGAFDPSGIPSSTVLELAALNASLETGIDSPIDAAILERGGPTSSRVKLGEIPFDFLRKRVTVVVADGEGARLITKGAFRHVIEACARLSGGESLEATRRDALASIHDGWARNGLRVIAVASGSVAVKDVYSAADEQDLQFDGFLVFADPPKAGAADAIRELARRGVSVRMITGDSALIARHVARSVGLGTDSLLTGDDLDRLSDEALWQAADRTDIFADVDPNQKERIILALKRRGHVVGFLGDGINDAPALHAADTGLAVETAVDVARQAADFVLLERGLGVIEAGVDEGRRTFANTLKYVLTTTSANLGNMISMAGASLVLPFFPLTAGQILLNNFLSDIPAVGLASDEVDPELVDRPRQWNIRFIGRYMVEFGALSSMFDFLTFGMLIVVAHASAEVFRTTWFVQSLLTELVIALVVRTRRPFYASRPGRLLLVTTVAVAIVAVVLPAVPHASLLGFVPISAGLLAWILVVTALYVAATELQKRHFYRREPA